MGLVRSDRMMAVNVVAVGEVSRSNAVRSRLGLVAA